MCVEFRRVFNIFLGTSQYCSASTVAGLGMQDKDTAFALSEFRNIMGNTQIRKQKIRVLCHKCYNMGSMGALWGKVE